MTTTREEFEAWMTSETNVREDAVWHEDKQRYTLLSRKQADWVLWQAAHLAGQRAMQERAAEACFDHHFDRWALYKGLAPYTGDEPGRADSFVSGESTGAETCEEIIRALEVKPS